MGGHCTAVWILTFLCVRASSLAFECPFIVNVGGSISIDCSNKQLTKIPTNLPSDSVTSLSMRGNRMTAIPPGTFGYFPNLTALDLSYNNFTEIPGAGLEALPRLQTINWSGNPLTSVADGVFRNLTSLVELIIQSTPLVTLSAEALRGLSSLQTLTLDYNQLSSLPANLLHHVQTLRTLTLRGNRITTLATNETTTNVLSLDISNNPLSCDCDFLSLLDSLSAAPPELALLQSATTVCAWPPELKGRTVSSLSGLVLNCTLPAILSGPQNTSVLSDRSVVLGCSVIGSPFPSVFWLKNGVPLSYSSLVYAQGTFNASLVFSNVSVDDSGYYQCVVQNYKYQPSTVYRSEVAVLKVTKASCFDGKLSSGETDVDCGGIYCSACNATKKCLLDVDCANGLVCLYPYSLPSNLQYISPNDPGAYQCANSTVAQNLLAARLYSSLPNANLSVQGSLANLTASLQTYLATLLGVSPVTIANLRVTSVQRLIQPLIQIWFDLPVTAAESAKALSTAVQLINNGQLKVTVKTTTSSSAYNVRMNI